MIVIDLAGPQGNAMAVIGQMSTWCKQLEYSKEYIASVQNDMMSGDYNHLLEVFDATFPDIDYKFINRPGVCDDDDGDFY